MIILKKITNNFLTVRAIQVLGASVFVDYILNFILQVFNIFKAKDLRPLDKTMGKKKIESFNYNSNKFVFDCFFCDETIKDGSYAFGVVREIYIRDCYFKYLPPYIYSNIKNVVDIGANRGAFSTLMTTTADFILSVEAQQEFGPVIKHNFSKNNYTNYNVEIGFVGTGGDLENTCDKSFTIIDLLDRNGIKQVDLLKMDIEGSEFSLFNNPDWLQRINAICMEVHPEYGNPANIVNVLHEFNFATKVSDADLNLLENSENANFIYAWKNV